MLLEDVRTSRDEEIANFHALIKDDHLLSYGIPTTLRSGNLMNQELVIILSVVHLHMRLQSASGADPQSMGFSHLQSAPLEQGLFVSKIHVCKYH